ncbi:MAG: DUF559 domain-containing protein [Polyangiaceae bacterium]
MSNDTFRTRTFFAPAQGLVVEVDGAYHAARGRADARRDASIVRAGHSVVRIEASLGVSDIERALSATSLELSAN